MSEWYIVRNAAEIDSPSLLIYRERVVENLVKAVEKTVHGWRKQ